MTLSVDWSTKTISIPQADLDLVVTGGTLYELDTETVFRQGMNEIMAGEEGIVFEDPISHNTEYSVAGVTYARKVEVINGYSVTFTPDSQWSVRLAGSNNNLFDVENGILNQNQVQAIAQNSAGLQTVGSGLTSAQDTKLTEAHEQLVNIEGSYDHGDLMRAIMSAVAGVLSGAVAGETGTAYFRNMADSKVRMTMTYDADGNRITVTYNDLT